MHRNVLGLYEWLWQRYSDRTESARRALTTRAGLGVERLLAFWEGLADEHAPTGAQRP